MSVSGAVNWVATMRARQLIDGAAFGPDTLKAIGQAFDAAWSEIASNYGNVPIGIDNARYRLASALLSVANEGCRDAEVEARCPASNDAKLSRTREKYQHRERNQADQYQPKWDGYRFLIV